MTQDDLHLSAHGMVVAATESASGGSPDEQIAQALSSLFQENSPAIFERIESMVVRDAYQHCRFNQVKTAKLLGVSRNVLRAKLIKIGEISALR